MKIKVTLILIFVLFTILSCDKGKKDSRNIPPSSTKVETPKSEDSDEDSGPNKNTVGLCENEFVKDYERFVYSYLHYKNSDSIVTDVNLSDSNFENFRISIEVMAKKTCEDYTKDHAKGDSCAVRVDQSDEKSDLKMLATEPIFMACELIETFYQDSQEIFDDMNMPYFRKRDKLKEMKTRAEHKEFDDLALKEYYSKFLKKLVPTLED